MTERERILKTIDGIAPTLREIALEIHANPELGFEEHRAASLWSDLLERHGFCLERNIAGLETAFKASNGSGAVTAAFMVEYDALPGIGHGCGHNLNGAAACGASIGLGSVVDQIGGRVIAFGSPGEEGIGGKVYIVEAGCLDGVDFAMMAHARDRHMGGMTHNAVARYKVMFHGKSAHAAVAPEEGINALDAVIQVFNGVNAMRQQMRQVARIHGIIRKGGDAPNIIPDYTEAVFYLREEDDEHIETLRRKFVGIIEGAATQTGARSEVEEFGRSYKASIPNKVLDRVYIKNAAELGVEIRETEHAFAKGSTDMGNVAQTVPGIHTAFQIAPEPTPVHSRAFCAAAATDAALESMVTAAKILALTAYDIITDADLLAEMKEEFRLRFGKAEETQASS